MFVAAAEERGDNLIQGRGDAYCGMLNASYNLKLRNVKVYIPEYPVGTAEECADMIHEFAPIAKAIIGLHSLKIISFGPRPLNFLACNAPIQQLYNLGVEIEENSELDLFEAFNKHADDERIPEIVKEMEEELGAGNKKPEILRKLAQYELTLKDWVEEHKGYFLACNAPIQQLYNLGVEIEENSELDLFEAFNKHADDERIPEIVKEMEEELGAGNKKPEILRKLAQYELTLKDWVEEHKGYREYVAIAGKCWPAFQTQFGFVPCYVNSRLTAQGIPVSCEVDIYGALSEFIGTVVSNDIVTLLDINNNVPADLYREDIEGKFDYTHKDTFMGFLSEFIGTVVSNDIVTLLDINNNVPADLYREDIEGKFDYTHKDTFMGFHCGNTGTVVSNDIVTLLDINNNVPADLYREDIEGKFDYTHKDTFMGFHCGNTASKKLSFCEMKYQLIMARSLPEEVTQGTLEGDIVPGDITFFRLQSTADCKLRAYIAQGEVLPVATRYHILQTPKYSRL